MDFLKFLTYLAKIFYNQELDIIDRKESEVKVIGMHSAILQELIMRLNLMLPLETPITLRIDNLNNATFSIDFSGVEKAKLNVLKLFTNLLNRFHPIMTEYTVLSQGKPVKWQSNSDTIYLSEPADLLEIDTITFEEYIYYMESLCRYDAQKRMYLFDFIDCEFYYQELLKKYYVGFINSFLARYQVPLYFEANAPQIKSELLTNEEGARILELLKEKIPIIFSSYFLMPQFNSNLVYFEVPNAEFLLHSVLERAKLSLSGLVTKGSTSHWKIYPTSLVLTQIFPTDLLVIKGFFPQLALSSASTEARIDAMDILSIAKLLRDPVVPLYDHVVNFFHKNQALKPAKGVLPLPIEHDLYANGQIIKK